jgi:hypothetical protein
MKIIRNLTAMAAVAATLTIASQARADTIDFFLTQGECTGTCGAGTAPAPISNALADHVIVNLLTSTSATVQFIAPSGSNIITPIHMNINDGGVLANVTATVSIAGGVLRFSPGQAEDHFGLMNTATGAVQAAIVTFNLTANNGFTWMTAASVLTPTTQDVGAAYGHGFMAATHEQFAGTFSPVPLPAALPLFATGLGALGLLGWRRKKKAPALAA